MELVLSSSHFMHPSNHSTALNIRFPENPFRIRRRRRDVNLHLHPFTVSSKKSSFPDFQDYAKPTRLVPARELGSFGGVSPNKFNSLLESEKSMSLYTVTLRTSSNYGSELSDLSAGILLCIIDEHGDSILERLPAIFCQHHTEMADDSVASEHVRFQRGSSDEFMLEGPKLGRVQSMWISLERGNWRLGGASLTTFSACNHETDNIDGNVDVYHSVIYGFEAEEILLGEGGDMSMTELRPRQVTEYSGIHPPSAFVKDGSKGVFVSDRRMSNEESMREYMNLKYSLLLYDSVLIFAGTSVSWLAGGDNTAIAYFTGGIAGFLYLLLLQRSVDRLPVPGPATENDRNSFDSLFSGVKGPLFALAFGLGVAVLAINRGTVEVEAAATALTPREIIVGMTGFLACKLSVVLAAVKPMSFGIYERN